MSLVVPVDLRFSEDPKLRRLYGHESSVHACMCWSSKQQPGLSASARVHVQSNAQHSVIGALAYRQRLSDINICLESC